MSHPFHSTRNRIVSPRGTTEIIHNVSPSKCLMVNTHLLLANVRSPGEDMKKVVYKLFV